MSEKKSQMNDTDGMIRAASSCGKGVPVSEGFKLTEKLFLPFRHLQTREYLRFVRIPALLFFLQNRLFPRNLLRSVAFLILIAGLGFLANSPGCQKNPVVPPDRLPDTTSHNFTWTIDTLGDGNSSVLNDVTIINDHLAYAVGEIYLKDSTGQVDPLPYNAAVWNGTQWTLKRITVQHLGSSVTPPLEGVFAFSSTDIWFSAGVPIHGDGQNWTQYHLFDMGVLSSTDGSLTKIWGTASTDLYFVGNKGTIVHYDGSQWVKIESGTTLDIYDIWGEGGEILAIGSSYTPSRQERKLLSIDPLSESITTLNDSGLAISLHSLWFETGKKHYIVGDGIFYADSPNPTLWDGGSNQITNFYTTSVRGNAANDLFVVGAYGECLHWNGNTWKSFRNEATGVNGALGDVAVHNNLAIAVGSAGGGFNDKAVVLVGMR